MSCPKYRAPLEAYIRNELSPAERARLVAHINGCADCRDELDFLLDLKKRAHPLPRRIEPARDLWPDIAGALSPRPQQPAATGARCALPRQGFGEHLLRRHLGWRPVGIALAAVVVLVLAGRLFIERRPAPPPAWRVERLDGAPQIGADRIHRESPLHPGQWLQTDAQSRARLSEERIGYVEIEPNSRLQLRSAATRHRVALAQGEIHAMIWAPPRLFFTETPAATAVDLGCAYTIKADAHGDGILRVTLGWVALVRDGREAVVPSGAEAQMRRDLGPGTPYYTSASPELRSALARLDFENGGAAEVAVIVREARPQDALTLYHLLPRVAGAGREAIYDKLAEVLSPPPGATREGTLALDPATLKLWRERLSLPWTGDAAAIWPAAGAPLAAAMPQLLPSSK